MKEYFKNEIWDWAEALAEALVIIIALVIFLWPTKIYGSSMEKSINNGDWVFSSKFALWLDEPEKGDIVMFKVKGVKGPIIKRVIGTEGDNIKIQDGAVIVNGEILEEKYAESSTEGSSELTVKKNHIYVLGDNRKISTDSRSFGQVPLDNVKSKILLRFYPLKNVTSYF